MGTAKKVVLVSKSGYRAEYDRVLIDLIAQKIELFCAVGKDCKIWEEVLDELCVGPLGEGTNFIATTSHPDKSVEEVIRFAESYITESPTTVEVIEI